MSIQEIPNITKEFLGRYSRYLTVTNAGYTISAREREAMKRRRRAGQGGNHRVRERSNENYLLDPSEFVFQWVEILRHGALESEHLPRQKDASPLTSRSTTWRHQAIGRAHNRHHAKGGPESHRLVLEQVATGIVLYRRLFHSEQQMEQNPESRACGPFIRK